MIITGASRGEPRAFGLTTFAVVGLLVIGWRVTQSSRPLRFLLTAFTIRDATPADALSIGIEITAPTKISLAALNGVLRDLGFPPASREDLAPLLAA